MSSADSITPHLVLGAAKSGKSLFAEKTIALFPPPYVYVATAQVLDQEMAERVRDHRARRRQFWTTTESPYDLVENLHQLQGRGIPVLVDCLTLWLSNLLLQESHDLDRRINQLVDFLKVVDYPLVLVANEVGGGIVPDNRLARTFRDLAGRTNQLLAAVCPAVTLIVAGLPLHLKRERDSSKDLG